MLDLVKLPARYVAQLGIPRVAEITGTAPSVISMWLARDRFPLSALQKLLDLDPTPIHEVKPFYTVPAENPRLAILIPSNRKPDTDTVASLFRMYNSATMKAEPFDFNSLYHVRNIAAQWFLDSELPLSFWSDDDMIHQCGDAAWFKSKIDAPAFPDVFAGLNTIHRMLVHGKKFMSSVYMARKRGGPLQFAGGETQTMRQLVARGPSTNILEVDWTGFGGVLIHREVFLDIMRTQPEGYVKLPYIREKLGYKYGFFNPIDQDFGDDISFCSRARKAGHSLYVDFAIMPGHAGRKVFTYQDQR